MLIIQTAFPVMVYYELSMKTLQMMLWIGTDPGGLNALDKKTEVCLNITYAWYGKI